MNVNAVNEYTRTGSLDIRTKTGDSKMDTVIGAFEDVFFSAANPMKTTGVTKNTFSGVSERVAAIEEALKCDAQVAKDNLKALFNKLSGAEAVAMGEDGWDLNDMDSEEILTVVDRIKIMLATYCEDYQLMSGDVDKDLIEEAVGGDAALAAKISQKLSGTYTPATKENVEQVSQALELAKGIPAKLDDRVISYLMKNHLEPTIADVYKAVHSAGESVVEPLTEGQWQQLLPQVDKVIKEAGLEPDTQSRSDARWLIEHQAELTSENLLKLEALKELNFVYDEDTVIEYSVNAMSDGRTAREALLTGEKEPSWKQLSQAAEILQKATSEDVKRVTSEYGTLTLARLSFSMNSVEGFLAINYSEEVSQAIVVNNRTLNEARLSLTAYTGKVLLQKGLDIFNEDLGQIVELLRETRHKMIIEEFSGEETDAIDEENIYKAAGFHEVLSGLRFMPSAAIGMVMSAGRMMSVANLHSSGQNLQRQYEQAGQAYDVMSTKVRADLGDDVSKAVEASAETILEGLGMEYTKANVRSVHILASNSMEITEENIYTVKEIDATLNNVMENISPQMVLSMIREGINPMESDIASLNRYIEENQQDATDEIEKFSEFLYVLDKDGSISPQERERFIGVYRMFNMFKKDSGKAIGALVNQGADITMGNLVMAISSRSSYGMDVRLEENAGMAQVVGKAAYLNTLFSSLGKKITPELLKKAEEKEFENMTLEEFGDLVDEAEKERNIRAQYYNEELNRMQNYAQAEEHVLRMLTDYDMPVTFHHLMAAEGLNKRAAALFGSIFEDEEGRGHLEELVDSLETEDSAKEAYARLNKKVDEKVMQMLSGENSEKLDLQELRQMTEGVKLMESLCERHNYIIPFETKEGVATINLKLVSDGEENGKISIDLNYGDDRQIYLECSVREKKLDIFVAEKSKTLNEEEITAGLSDQGYEEIYVSHIKSEMAVHGAGVHSEQIPTKMLYRTAKTIVQNLMAAETK